MMKRLAGKYASEVKLFVEVCHRLSRNVYVTSQGGNLAWRLEKDVILITPTQLNKAEVTPGDVVFITMKGTVIEGIHRPTGETPMYLEFFRNRPDIATVIHCHPPMTNAFAITNGTNWLMRPIFPETVIEVGPVPVVPYGVPLSEQLGRNFVPYLQRYNAFLMENHGLVVMSQLGISWTMMVTELLEQTAMSIVHVPGDKVKELSRKDVRDLDEVMRVRKLPMIGAPGANKSIESLYFPKK